MPRKTSDERKRSELWHRFNEAAARCRGKRGFSRGLSRATPICFNEAAARCRGKLLVVLRVMVSSESASMRPRPDAAEN